MKIGRACEIGECTAGAMRAACANHHLGSEVDEVTLRAISSAE